MAVSFGRFGVVLAGFGLLASWLALPALGASFYLKTGDVVEGTVLDATRNTVMLRVGGAVRPTSIGQIERVEVRLADGRVLSGRFSGWRDGVLELRSSVGLQRVAEGRLLESEAREVASAAAGDEAVSLSMDGLPELVLTDGRVLSGRIIHATGSIVTIRSQAGGVVPTSRAKLDQVRFVASDGTAFSGELVDWSEDVYRVRLADRREVLARLDAEVSVASSAETAIASTDAAALPSTEGSSSAGDAAAADGSADEALANEVSADEALANEVSANEALAGVVGAGGPAPAAQVADLAAADGSVAIRPAASRPRILEAEVPAVSEDGDAVVFRFRLDHPADRPLVILYAATDDTAKAGEDFEAQSGVITFPSGSSFAEIRVPLIDDDHQEPVEQFHLFLSGDPDAIEFGERQIVATIQDND